MCEKSRSSSLSQFDEEMRLVARLGGVKIEEMKTIFFLSLSHSRHPLLIIISNQVGSHFFGFIFKYSGDYFKIES